MALHTLGTAATTSLVSLGAWSAALAPADVAAIGQTISPDKAFAALLSGYGAGATAVLATGTTHSNTTLDTLVTSAGAPLAQINVGDLVIGAGIPAGTFVVSKPTTTSVVLSQAATASASGVYVAFLRVAGKPMIDQNGILYIPGRGSLKVLPGDYIAIDNTGWPILVSGAAVGYLGSQWSFT